MNVQLGFYIIGISL